MSQFVLDTFAQAKAMGLTDGFVGTYLDLKEALNDAFWADQEQQAEAAVERYYESGWPGHDQYVWEEEQDRLRTALTDPINFPAFEAAGSLVGGVFKPLFTEENDPDGEAENAWHEQQGDLAAEAKASAWFAFPGDRH